MSEMYNGFIITFENAISQEKFESFKKFLYEFTPVISVDPIVDDIPSHFIRMQVTRELKKRLWEAIEDDDNEEKEEDKPLWLKLLYVCVEENNGAIIDSLPMFMAAILKELPSSFIPHLLDELKQPTVEAHNNYNKWLKEG